MIQSFPLNLFQEIATLIGADPKDIVFTSGATESNNMAIKGVARFHKEKKRHIITTQTVRLTVSQFTAQFNYSHLHRNTNAFWILAGNYKRKGLM